MDSIALSVETQAQLVAFFAPYARAGSPIAFKNNLTLLQITQNIAADRLMALLPAQLLTAIDAVIKGERAFVYVTNLPVHSPLPPVPETITGVPAEGQIAEYIMLGLSRLVAGSVQQASDMLIENVIKDYPDAKYEPWHTHPRSGIVGLYGHSGPSAAVTRMITAQRLYDNADMATQECLLKAHRFFADEEKIALLERDDWGELCFSFRMTREENNDDLLEHLIKDARHIPPFADPDRHAVLMFLSDHFDDEIKHDHFRIMPGHLLLCDQAKTLRAADPYTETVPRHQRRWATALGCAKQASERHRHRSKQCAMQEISAPQISPAETAALLTQIHEHHQIAMRAK